MHELRETPNLKKTRLCLMFEKGMCFLGNQCSFAHGERQLRSTNLFYKTTMCAGFIKGICTKNNNCRYAHGEHELRYP